MAVRGDSGSEDAEEEVDTLRRASPAWRRQVLITRSSHLVAAPGTTNANAAPHLATARNIVLESMMERGQGDGVLDVRHVVQGLHDGTTVGYYTSGMFERRGFETRFASVACQLLPRRATWRLPRS